MRTFAAFSVIFLLLACATAPVGQGGIPGTYDLISFGSLSVPNPAVQQAWIQMTRQGSWEMHEEPGTRFRTRGIYSAGDTIDGCIQVDLWPEVAPGVTSPMQFCDLEADGLAYLDPTWVPGLDLDGLLVFKRRQ